MVNVALARYGDLESMKKNARPALQRVQWQGGRALPGTVAGKAGEGNVRQESLPWPIVSHHIAFADEIQDRLCP